MGFKDIEALAGSTEQLQNVVLSHNPCPSCVECNGMIMDYASWADSEWGLPGSDGRLCSDSCHCALIPVDMLPDLPGIGDLIKLRGDKGTDIRKIIEVGPHENDVSDLLKEWKELTGSEKLPREISDMEFDDIEPLTRKAVEKARERVRRLARGD
jgi:hypothetical protein